MKKTTTAKRNILKRFRKQIRSATSAQIEEASQWYLEAESIAAEIARNLDTTIEIGASIISAFSPRQRWSVNVAQAIAFSLGGKPRALTMNMRMAEAVLISGFDALTGRKTNAFARAIAGDEEAVVVDIWMMRAAGYETDRPTPLQYMIISDCVRIVSVEFGLTPRTTQALLWILERNGVAE